MIIVKCKKCGKLLGEMDNETNQKIVEQFCSLAIRKDDDGNNYYLCINCHENIGVPMTNIGPYSVRDEELILKRTEKPSTVFKITD